MAVNSLEKLMNVPIDHYATIDMDGLHDMIDTLGGVDVVVMTLSQLVVYIL